MRACSQSPAPGSPASLLRLCLSQGLALIFGHEFAYFSKDWQKTSRAGAFPRSTCFFDILLPSPAGFSTKKSRPCSGEGLRVRTRRHQAAKVVSTLTMSHRWRAQTVQWIHVFKKRLSALRRRALFFLILTCAAKESDRLAGQRLMQVSDTHAQA